MPTAEGADFEYDHYRDAHGVTWKIIATRDNIIATMDPDAPGPKYEPVPPDMGPAKRNYWGAESAGEKTDMDRKSFLVLVDMIEKYAAANGRYVVLPVHASPPNWMAWAFLGWLAYEILGKGR